MITEHDITDLCNAARITGLKVEPNEFSLLKWDAGLHTHIPLPLPPNSAAVYVFEWNKVYLKVGKVNSNSNARYQSHHYNPNSSNSNLAKSLLSNAEFQSLIDNGSIGDWIKMHTTRYNIIIPIKLGKNFVHFAEAFFILKYKPKFENTRA
jgi:hypothetical protein